MTQYTKLPCRSKQNLELRRAAIRQLLFYDNFKLKLFSMIHGEIGCLHHVNLRSVAFILISNYTYVSPWIRIYDGTNKDCPLSGRRLPVFPYLNFILSTTCRLTSRPNLTQRQSLTAFILSGLCIWHVILQFQDPVSIMLIIFGNAFQINASKSQILGEYRPFDLWGNIRNGSVFLCVKSEGREKISLSDSVVAYGPRIINTRTVKLKFSSLMNKMNKTETQMSKEKV